MNLRELVESPKGSNERATRKSGEVASDITGGAGEPLGD